MKNILTIEPEIEDLQARIFSKKNKKINDILYDSKKWPHLLELFEHTNEIVGYEFLMNTRGYIVPRPVLIEGYTSLNFFLLCSGEKIETTIFKHRDMIDLNFLTKIYAMRSELKRNRDTDSIMSQAVTLTKEMLKKEKGKEIILISGPISSGGAGNPVENLRIFNKAIIGVSQRNSIKKVFNQMYFEDLFSLVHKILVEKGSDQSSDYFIDNYYEELMEEGFFSEMYQIPGWKTSRGAIREDLLASKIGISKHQIDFEILLPENIKYPTMAY